jgi:hypothetical protein
MTDKQSVAALVTRAEEEAREAARVYVPVAMFHVRSAVVAGGDVASVHVIPRLAVPLARSLEEEFGIKVEVYGGPPVAGYSSVRMYDLQSWYSENKAPSS